jgi:hypothetical protein
MGRLVLRHKDGSVDLGHQNAWVFLRNLDTSEIWSIHYYQPYVADVEVSHFVPGEVHVRTVLNGVVDRWWTPGARQRRGVLPIIDNGNQSDHDEVLNIVEFKDDSDEHGSSVTDHDDLDSWDIESESEPRDGGDG